MKETLEEASKNRGLRWHKEGTIGFMHSKGDFVAGAKWQAEKMYSEEDLKQAYLEGCEIKLTNVYHLNKWFEQFKKK